MNELRIVHRRNVFQKKIQILMFPLFFFFKDDVRFEKNSLSRILKLFVTVGHLTKLYKTFQVLGQQMGLILDIAFVYDKLIILHGGS